jgi:hypothetical protein
MMNGRRRFRSEADMTMVSLATIATRLPQSVIGGLPEQLPGGLAPAGKYRLVMAHPQSSAPHDNSRYINVPADGPYKTDQYRY